MPQYQFVGEILLPYARETQTERKLTTLQRERYIIDRLMWFDGDTLSDDPDRCTLNGARVREYRELRKAAGAQPRTVARELSMAARSVRYMQAEHDLDCPNPFAGRTMTKRDRVALEPRQWRDFTPAEEARVFLAADPAMRDIILFALATGCRLSEILHLTWDRVLPDRLIFTPATQKSGRHGVRMLNATAVAVIAKQRERGPYVFSGARGRPYKRDVMGARWVQIRKKAQIGPVTFHDLRRIAGQRMLEATGDLVAVQHQPFSLPRQAGGPPAGDGRGAFLQRPRPSPGAGARVCRCHPRVGGRRPLTLDAIDAPLHFLEEALHGRESFLTDLVLAGPLSQSDGDL